MSSPLLFVRDGRTLPFVPVTIAALDAIRATCETPRAGGERRSYPHALATYMALLELANEARADRVAVTQRDLGEKAMASRSAVQAALGDLQDAGVVVKREQVHGRARIENEYVVVEPEQRSEAQETAPSPLSDAGVASDRRRSAGARPSPPSGARARKPVEGEEARDARPPIEHRLPDDLPTYLHEAAITAGRVLHRAAKARGQKRVVMLEAVGRAVGQRPTKDHVAIAEAVEHWLCWGNGQKAPCADIVARFRSFMADAPDVRLPNGSPLAQSPSSAGNVHPIHGRRMSSAEQVEAQIQALRAEQ